MTRAASQGPAALDRSACEPAGLGLCFMSPFRLVCGCRCRSAWQRHPHRHMARARCLMSRWRGRGIQHRCCKMRELHARGCCNKSVACEPLDHHLQQIGTTLIVSLIRISNCSECGQVTKTTSGHLMTVRDLEPSSNITEQEIDGNGCCIPWHILYRPAVNSIWSPLTRRRWWNHIGDDKALGGITTAMIRRQPDHFN